MIVHPAQSRPGPMLPPGPTPFIRFRDLPARLAVVPLVLLLGVAPLSPAGTGVAPARAQFGDPNENAKIMIHLVPTSQVGGQPCRSSKGRLKCDEMNVSGSVGEYYYAYVVVTDGDAGVGIAGLQFGVKYNRAAHLGVDITEWQACGTLEFQQPPNFLASGGNMITFDPVNNCQRFEPSGAGTGVTAVAGYFYLTSYTPDRLEITRRPNDNFAKVADCSSNESVVDGVGAPVHSKSYLGYVEFSDRGETPGYNPCGLAKPVVAKTWSAVKKGGE